MLYNLEQALGLQCLDLPILPPRATASPNERILGHVLSALPHALLPRHDGKKVERSGERNMAKIFFMNIMNIVLLMDLQLQPPPSREFLAMHFLHSPQLSSLAMGCIHCWGGCWPASP